LARKSRPTLASLFRQTRPDKAFDGVEAVGIDRKLAIFILHNSNVYEGSSRRAQKLSNAGSPEKATKIYKLSPTAQDSEDKIFKKVSYGRQWDDFLV
jgi:hypothetical protein